MVMKNVNFYIYIFNNKFKRTNYGSGMSTLRSTVYIQEHIPTKRVVQYTHLREADVMWGKRVWRTIDLRENES